MRARKRFGQHFLEPAWVARLVDHIDPQPADAFIEVGPGRGALTLALAPRCRHLTAIEIDRDLAAGLAGVVPANVTLVVGDVLSTDLSTLLPERGPVRLVGNLPYNISSPLLARITRFAREAALIDAHLLLQKEVADRLAAGPGSKTYGVLGILVQLDADIEQRLTLPPGAFRPPPKVTSALVRLRFRAPVVQIGSRELFERLVRTIFSRRRKTLANALAPLCVNLAESSAVVLERAGIDARRRPETLTLAELAVLAQVFASATREAVL